MWSLGTLRVSVLLTAFVVPQFAAADDFFASKTVNFIVGTDISGGFSIYARLIAKYLPQYIPGKPTIVVKSMPGAGGVTAASYLYRDAPSDGTTFAALTPNAISAKVIDDFAQSQFDPTKFKYLAGAERGSRLCMSFHTSKIASFLDAQKLKAVIGVTSAGSPTTQYAAFHKHALGAQFDIVSGYRGPADIFLAMERGEIDGTCGLDWSALKAQQPEWLRDKKLNLLVQDNIEPDPELSALGVPQPWPFIKDEIDRRAVELMIGFQQAFGKAYVAPPRIPDDRLQVLREAFGGALHDKRLQAEAEKLRIEIAPQTGDQIARVVYDLYSAPKPVTERLKKIVVP
jgi:tripartite-type tricarboxylate transporter receptor subunit TctC